MPRCIRTAIGLFCCLFWSLASAQSTVSLAANFSFASPPPFAGSTLTVDFTVPERSADFDLPIGFGFYGVPAVLTIDGVVHDTQSSLLGWFSYDTGYAGIDVRFDDVFAPSDQVQIILETTTPLFTRAGGVPVLQGLSLSGLTGTIVYYPLSAAAVLGSTSAGSYVAVVPEPSAALLALLGLGAVGWRLARVRRRA